MSLASMQSIKVTNSLLNSSSHSCTSLSTVSKVPFCTTKRSTITITCSQADGPLRRPSIASPPVRPSAPENPPPAPVSAPPEPTVVGQNVVTMEFQRQKAKELQQYFKQKKLEEANVGPFFGFIAKNEISNGRDVTSQEGAQEDRDKERSTSLFGCWCLGICRRHPYPVLITANLKHPISDGGRRAIYDSIGGILLGGGSFIYYIVFPKSTASPFNYLASEQRHHGLHGRRGDNSKC